MELGLVATFFSGMISGIFFKSFIDLEGPFSVLLSLISITLFLTWKLSSPVQVKSRFGFFVPGPPVRTANVSSLKLVTGGLILPRRGGGVRSPTWYTQGQALRIPTVVWALEEKKKMEH